jgi:hypothetical protein
LHTDPDVNCASGAKSANVGKLPIRMKADRDNVDNALAAPPTTSVLTRE